MGVGGEGSKAERGVEMVGIYSSNVYIDILSGNLIPTLENYYVFPYLGSYWVSYTTVMGFSRALSMSTPYIQPSILMAAIPT